MVNLLRTAYLDSTALAILHAALQDARASGGILGLVFVQPQMSRLFAMTGLSEAFPIYSTEIEAVDAIRARRAWGPGGTSV